MVSESNNASPQAEDKEAAVEEDVNASNVSSPKGAISRIAITPLFDLSSAQMAVQLTFSDIESELLHAEQGLANTLWIASAITQAISSAMEDMQKHLCATAFQECVGEDFIEVVENLESSTQKVREMTSAIGDSGSA